MKRSRFVKRSAMTLFAVLLLVAAGTVSGKTLTVHMIANDLGYAYLTNEVVPAFEAEHGVKVDIVRVTWGTRLDRLVTTTAGGVPPDIFMSGAEQIPELVAAGWLHPIDHYVADWPELDDFFPPALGSSEYKGIRYGLPIYTSPRPFWYRMDLFAEGGLDPHAPPTNWAELLYTAKRLTRTQGDRVVQQGFDLHRLNGTGNNGNLQEFSIFLYQNGGRFFDPATNKADFANEIGYETVAFMKELREAVLPAGYSVDTGGGAGNHLFRRVSAIRVDTSNIIRDFYNPDLDLSQEANMRAIVPPPGEALRSTMVFSDWFGIHAHSEQKDLAWEFMKLFHSAEVLRDYGLAAGYQSPRLSTYPDFVERQPMVRYVYETLFHAVPYPVFASPPSVLIDAFGPRYRSVLNNEQGSVSALQEAARLWDISLP